MNTRTWHDIGSDTNWIEYGGNWARQVTDTTYHVIRFENCEEWGDGATGYHVSLVQVDLESTQLAAALQSMGSGDPADDLHPLNQVYALGCYGAYAPLWQESGTNAGRLMREAKRESRSLSSDATALEDRLDRPVNSIGSTAREYAAGDVLSAVLRGVAEGDPRAELMMKMGVR